MVICILFIFRQLLLAFFLRSAIDNHLLIGKNFEYYIIVKRNENERGNVVVGIYAKKKNFDIVSIITQIER